MQRVAFNANDHQQGTNLFHLRGDTTQHLLKCPQDVRFELFSKQLWTAPMLGLIDMSCLMPEFCPYNKTVLLSSLGYRQMGSAAKSFDKYKQEEWNQYRVKRTSKDFQIYINGEAAVTIPFAESVTPFFGLGSSGQSWPCMRWNRDKGVFSGLAANAARIDLADLLSLPVVGGRRLGPWTASFDDSANQR